MVSDEKPFKVTDRRFTTTSFVYNLPEDKASDKNTDSKTYAAMVFRYKPREEPVGDECDEAFRTAYLGESAEAKAPYESSDSTRASGNTSYTPSGAVAEKYEPVPVIEPHVSAAPHKDSNADSRFLNRVFGSVLLVGGLGLGIALYIGNQNNTSRNYTPPRSSYTQAQQTQRETFRAREVSAEFRAYREALASEYAEFKNGEHVTLSEIPIPPELSNKLNDPYNVPQAFAIDMNDDGINEVVLQEGCGSGGCWGQIYQKTDTGFVTIIDESVRVLSKEKTNGYRNAFLIKKVYLPAGGFTDVATKYVWNGQTYQKAIIISDPEMLTETASNFRDF